MRLAERILARFGLQRMRKRAAYAGAAVGRLNADWIMAPTQSADQDVRGDHRRLTARARDLARNNPYVRRFIELFAENVIGPDGVKLQARVRKADGDTFDEAINSAIERAWKRWGEPETASADGRLSWVDIETQLAETFVRDGEAIVRMLPGFDNEFGFALQVLDPDLLDVDHNTAAIGTGNEIRQGVEINRWGRPIAFWLWSHHPSDASGIDALGLRERVRVPAEQLIHLYDQDRPAQTRGVTRLAAVMMRLNMLGGLEEAELVAARTAAAKMGFFTEDAENPGPAPDPNDPNASRVAMEAEPGLLSRLPPGLKFEAWDPQHPSTAFGPFVATMLQGIAAGLGVSYASLTSDLTKVNYSSIRAGLLTERDGWRKLQRWFICHLHRRVFREWLKYATASGALQLPLRNVARWGDVEWQPRGWDWTDPQKDIDASLTAIDGGLDSLTRVSAARGRDIEEVFAERRREIEMAKKYGVTLVTKTTAGGNDGSEGDEDVEDAEDDAARGVDRARRLRLARGG